MFARKIYGQNMFNIISIKGSRYHKIRWMQHDGQKDTFLQFADTLR